MRFSKYIQFLAVISLCAAGAFGQSLRGYSVGRYEGQAFNTTRNATGKIVVELTSIDAASGAVIAHFTASDGLKGDGDLTGKIDAAGVLRLAGGIGDWRIALAGKVKADEIRANYKLTGASSQTGNFIIKLIDDESVVPPDDNDETATVAPPKVDNAGKTPVAPPVMTVPTAVTPPRTQTTTGVVKQQDDDPEKSGYPKPDFSEMTRWYDIQAYDYDVFKSQLVLMIKAKVESRPDSFRFDYLDADGVAVYSQQFFGLWHAGLLNTPEKFSVTTPSEGQMAKVKTVRVVRIVQ